MMQGALWGGLAFTFEYPLEAAKYACQARPHLSNTEALKQYIEKKGPQGLYDGGMYNLAKRIVRGSYRWPTICAMQDQWDKILPNSMMLKHIATNAAAAGSISCVEVFGVLPLEKLMVSKLNNQKYQGVKSLYDGATPMFLNYWASWSTYLICYETARKAAKQLDLDNKHPILAQCARSGMVASGMSALLPLEFTQYQMQTNPLYKGKSTLHVMSDLFKKHGMKGFYSGYPFAFTHRVAQVFFGSLFFDKLMDSRKQRSEAAEKDS
jgi:hypothetical protein